MKQRPNHLKSIQKEVIRSVSRKKYEAHEDREVREFPKKPKELLNTSEHQIPEKIYDEFVPADQQVSRVPGRNSYH